MAFVPVPNVAMVEFRYTWDSQRVENTLYFRWPEPFEGGIMEALADDLFSWWEDYIKPIQSNQVALREIVVTDLTTATAPVWVRVSSPPVNGGNLGSALPNNVTIALKFSTSGRGRSSRGRNYLIGLVESDVVGNTIDGATATNWQSAYAVLPATVSPSSWSWVVVSRFTNGAPRTTGIASQVTAVGFTDGTVDSQRRRLPGRGR